MHTCVGRIRYLGVLLYDADKIHEYANANENELVEKQLNIYLNPNDPEVIRLARENGIADSTIEYAQKSPIWKFVKEWKIALPLHTEFRTLPNLFYVPPLLPTTGNVTDGKYSTTSETFWAGIDATRLPMKYLANLFSAGNVDTVKEVMKKLMAVRMHRRNVTVGDLPKDAIADALKEVNLSTEMADAIFRLTSLPKFEDRFVIPPAHREESIEMLKNTQDYKGSQGFGFNEEPDRIL